MREILASNRDEIRRAGEADNEPNPDYDPPASSASGSVEETFVGKFA